MNSLVYKVRVTQYFRRQIDKLSKSNYALRKEVWAALYTFDKRLHSSIGNKIYKIRLRGHNKGKSGGYRLLTCVLEIRGVLIPVCIYPKSRRENLTDEELTKHVNCIQEELGVRW